MRHKTVLVSAVLLFIAAVSLTAVESTLQTPPSSHPLEPFALRISFGHGESPQERWPGTITVQQAEISEFKGWLLREEDRLSLHTLDFQTVYGRARKPDPKGILLRGKAGPAARIQVATKRGDCSFRIRDLEPGVELEFLDQGVRVSGLQSTLKLTDDLRDDDYPAWEAPRPMEIAPVHPNEATEAATIRSYRSFVQGVENRIVRGDFHRRTELSLDTAGGLIEGSLFPSSPW